MLRVIIILLTIFSATNSLYGQSKLLLDSIKLTDSLKLITTSYRYKEYEFSVESRSELLLVSKELKYLGETESSQERGAVVIRLICKGKILKMWLANPSNSTIEFNHKYYFFDFKQLALLHIKYPLNYFIVQENFNSETELDLYYPNLLMDTSFLYIVPPDFENQLQGSFHLTFPRNDTFTSPQAIFEYVNPIMEKILSKEKYFVCYAPFGDAKNDSQNEFTISIESDYKLFELFNDKNAKKSSWIPHLYPAYIIRKSK